MKIRIFLTLGLFLSCTAFSAKPILKIESVIHAPATIISGREAVASFKVTNNTLFSFSNITVRDLPQGVSQNPVGSGLSPQSLITCSSNMHLGPNASCELKLDLVADLMNDQTYGGPKICLDSRAPYPGFCSTPEVRSDVIHTFKVASSKLSPALTVSPSTVTLLTGQLTSMTVTNESNATISNIQADFSSTALEDKVLVVDVNQTEQCKSLAPRASCTLSLITYSQTAIAATTFTIKGANSQTVVGTASVAYAPPNPIYINLMQDVLINADLWADDPIIMSANYGYDGIEGATYGEKYVKRAGGAWGTVLSTLNPPYGAVTSTENVAAMASAHGYVSYYNDAMPICFSWPVLPSTVNITNFAITLNTGQTVLPATVTLVPNEAYNTRSCVVVFGEFGNRLAPGEVGAVYPTRVTIVDNGTALKLVGKNGPVSIVGQSIDSSNPYVKNGGPSLLAAKLSVMSAVGQDAPDPFNVFIPNDGIAMYGASRAEYRLRLYTSGGFQTSEAPSVDRALSLMPTDYHHFFQIKVEADGQTTWLYEDNKTYSIQGYGDITISGLATLGKAGAPLNDAYLADNDNYIDIVLYGDEAAMRKITAVKIPVTGANPATKSPYLCLYNPGGPGNSPTPGIRYTQCGPTQEMPVTQALDDPNTVTYP